MTDDIVTRLRNHVRGDFEKTSEFMLGLAADEIERLRADVTYWKGSPYCPHCGCGACQDNEQVLNNE